MLKNKIDRALEKEIKRTGAMGTETVTAHLELTPAEVKEFKDHDWYTGRCYKWEFDGNRLYITYCEDGIR